MIRLYLLLQSLKRYMRKRTIIFDIKSAVLLMPDTTYELPYEGAKEMLLVDDIDSKEFLTKLFYAWKSYSQQVLVL